MFRNPPKPRSTPRLPGGVGKVLAFADGFFFRIRRSALDFGRDRWPPVAWRPGLTLWRREPALAVLPSTTRGRRNSRRFFAIPPSAVLFTRPDGRRNFRFWRYESIGPAGLGRNIGMVSHSLRIQGMEWIVKVCAGE